MRDRSSRTGIPRTENVVRLFVVCVLTPAPPRTWVLTYTDSDTRVVRAGVDGGKSTARSLGLVEEGVGEAKDAFVFFMTRESEREDLELRS